MTPESYAQFIRENASVYADAKSRRIGAELKLKSAKLPHKNVKHWPMVNIPHFTMNFVKPSKWKKN